jgi:hypothetical protein
MGWSSPSLPLCAFHVARGSKVARHRVVTLFAQAQRKDRQIEEPAQALVRVADRLGAMFLRVGRHHDPDVVARHGGHREVAEHRARWPTGPDLVRVRLEHICINAGGRLGAHW